ncbi:MAG: 4-hydroxy-3-methylbut-2-enyl diphosphate reductase [Crocinitomicaceae bacterium]
MKDFEIPFQFQSWYINQIKGIRQNADKLKKDLSPSELQFNKSKIYISRHFGFCFGVQSAVEKVYQVLEEHKGKNIYLISEIIHNQEVNDDLRSKGIQFIQNTKGEQLIPWENINQKDIVLIPAFGTTLETLEILKSKKIQYEAFDTTCPFVERVWNKAEKLGSEGYTVIIHGKFDHEETRASFSHAAKNSKVIVISNLENAKMLSDFILGKNNDDRDWNVFFKPFASTGFNFRKDLERIALVNQTTMLANETQIIADFLKDVMIKKHGIENIDHYFGSTRDTLCYATNDNQSASKALLDKELDLAIVVGGQNSSNTKHLVELLNERFPTYFIQSDHDLTDDKNIIHFDLKEGKRRNVYGYLPSKEQLKIGITSGASCPDALLERVFLKLIHFVEGTADVDAAINNLKERINGL